MSTINIGNIGPHILESMRAEPHEWKTILGELCDNSFDAHASRVEISFKGKKAVVVKDDGKGCDDIAAMLTIGNHYNKGSKGLGRYGIGLKNAACWLWGRLEITTVHKGTKRKADVNWALLCKSGSWEVDSPLVTAASDGDIGTSLAFVNIDRQSPQFEKIADQLGYIFSPAIRHGKQIIIRRASGKDITVAPWQPPSLHSIVSDEFHVNGKGVRLYAGIIPEGQVAKRFGFHFSHRHRVIKEGCGLGAKGRSVTRICGLVDLDGSWTLTKNKTDIVDDSTDLENAIWERCGEIIMQSEEQASVIFNTELQLRVTEALRDCMDGVLKARRPGGGGRLGAKEPTGKGGQHRRARNTQAGPGGIADKVNVGKLRMVIAPLDGELIGKADICDSIVYLNQSHPRVMLHRESHNYAALVDMCLTVLSYEVTHQEQRPSLPIFREYSGFMDMLSSLTKSSYSSDQEYSTVTK